MGTSDVQREFAVHLEFDVVAENQDWYGQKLQYQMVRGTGFKCMSTATSKNICHVGLIF